MRSWLRFAFLLAFALAASNARTFNAASEFRPPEEDDNSLSSVRDFRVVEDEEKDDFSVGDSSSEEKEGEVNYDEVEYSELPSVTKPVGGR